jgi:hypothetical protein
MKVDRASIDDLIDGNLVLDEYISSPDDENQHRFSHRRRQLTRRFLGNAHHEGLGF